MSTTTSFRFRFVETPMHAHTTSGAADRRLLPARLALGAALVALSAAACQRPAPDAGAAQKLATRVVRVTDVARGDVVETVEITGELLGAEEVRVFAQVTERIDKLLVDEGDRVKAGQVLAVVRSDLLRAGEKQARAAMAAANANLDALRDQLQRTRALARAGAATAAQLESLEAQERAAAAQVQQMNAALSQASTQRGFSEVRAPISGVVTLLAVRAGDFASPQAPLMTIVRDDEIKAVLRVPERDFLRVRAGMSVRLAPLATPDQAAEAKVSLRGPVVDRTTRTGLVEVHLKNADGRLVAGSVVRAVIELNRRPDVVLVPAEAILFSNDTDRTGEATAFVADGTVARRRPVRVGVRQGGDIEIVEGLEPGERLIVQGAAFVRDGNPIEILTASRQAATPPLLEGGTGETK